MVRTWRPPRLERNGGSGGGQGIGPLPPPNPPPHVVLAEGLTHVSQQLEQMQRELVELRRLIESGRRPTEG